MEYAIIVFGLLAIGCTCMLFMTISTYNRKISEIHRALANIHVKSMELESEMRVRKRENKNSSLKQKVKPNTVKEVIYKVPKKISGDLTMTHHGKSALVQATLKVKKTE